MAISLSPWRALRPILLAGAATAAWLTLSSTPALADASADSASLLGGVTSSVSSLSVPLTGAVAPLQAAVSPEGLPANSAGLVQPLVGSVAGTADQLVAAVPVLNTVVPADTVTSLAAPVALAADSVAAGLVETVVPPLADAVPVLEPVLQPVVELTAAAVAPVTASLPVTLTGVPVNGISAAEDSPLAEGALTPEATDVGLASDPGTSDSTFLVPQVSLATTAAIAGSTSSAMRSAAPGSPWTGDPSTPLAPVPAVPASGAGSGASPSGPTSAAAWVDDFGLNLLLPGAFPISASPEHAPSPVSFDPGSSPD
jgi:hypothetical protein